MRAFDFWMGLAALGWLAGVLFSAAASTVPALRFAAGPTHRLVQTLSRTDARCRVLLLGSSTVEFGLAASQVHAASGCLAVNLSMLQVGDVLDAYLDSALTLARPGDVVVLSDRRWTAPANEGSPCSAGLPGAAFLAAVHVVPYVRGAWRTVGGQVWARSAPGDLLEFPPPAPRFEWASGAPLPDVDCRLKVAAREVQRIRAAGAWPVLAATPILVSEAQRPALARQLEILGQRMQALVGDGAWVDPLLDSDARLFAWDGRHASELGRERWTAKVVEALRGHMVPLPPAEQAALPAVLSAGGAAITGSADGDCRAALVPYPRARCPARRKATMNPATFEEFKSRFLAQGFDEVLVREWSPGQVLDTHTHPFSVQALVVRGSFTLSQAGGTREVQAGDWFELAPEAPHAEHYGPEGATFWVARRRGG